MHTHACVCVCAVYVCFCVYSHMYTGTCGHKGQRTMLSNISQPRPLVWHSPNSQAGWPLGFRDPAVYAFSGVRLYTPIFFLRAGGLNPGSHACTETLYQQNNLPSLEISYDFILKEPNKPIQIYF